MAASLRRAIAPLRSAACGAAAAALQEGRAAAGSGSDQLLRAAASGLRQLQGAGGASWLRSAAAPTCSGAGARGFASAAEPAPAEPPGTSTSNGGSANGNGSGSARAKPRFLLERLAGGQPGGASNGTGSSTSSTPGGRPSTWANRGKPNAGQHASGSGSSSTGARQPTRDGRQQQRQPWARQGDDTRQRPAGQRQEGQHQRQEGQAGHRPQQPGRPQHQQQQQHGRPQHQQQHQQQQRGGRQEGQEQRRPHRGTAAATPAAHGDDAPRGGGHWQRGSHGRGQESSQPGRRQGGEREQRPHDAPPPWQQRFEVPKEFPTAFPSAFPRAGGSGSAAAANGGKDRKDRKAAKKALEPQAPQAPEEIVIPEDINVLRLSQLLGEPIGRVEEVLAELGENVASRHDLVSPDSAELAALEFGKIAVLARRGGRDAPLDADAVPRPAVITVMGHVDHGKTTLLDAFRKTSVAAGEAGGITQHIGAFEVQMPGSQQSLTFLDTPGHAAFTSMRARGAAVTDIVVLVVAADDGIMPQTREAISHARAAGCPIVVAITKCDTERANAAKVRQQLVAAGLELEEVGGNVQVVEVAAPTGLGLPELEEALLLQAEMMELQASRSRRAEAVVIEAKMDKGQGPMATVVVKRGTLKVGQPMVVGTEWGRVRALRGTGGRTVEEVLPGQPAEIAGLKGLPQAGDQLLVVDSEERAQAISRARAQNAEWHRRAALGRMVAEQQEAAAEGDGEQRTLPVIIKADVQGSAEAVRDALAHMCTEQVRVQVVHTGVGPVSHSDVQLAIPLGARILGFNVRSAAGDVEDLAKMHGIEIRCQRVIYHLMEDVGGLLVGASPKQEVEVVAGAAEVLALFPLKGARGKDAGVVAGCRVTEGSIKGSLQYRVLRGGEVVHTGPCASLKRHKLEVETVGKGTECGVLLEGFSDIQPGDVLQCVTTELRATAQVQAGPEKEWHL